jgi:hypothetical protein
MRYERLERGARVRLAFAAFTIAGFRVGLRVTDEQEREGLESIPTASRPTIVDVHPRVRGHPPLC